ncbi:hypothetical protein TCAL_05157 [Tigriopus californicus]|uniref:GDNF/GAS1 domain-containing protein n=1 Tax=Tigriopus californicus TaxID=6832 RepID=A0A553NNR9_TIGCA|nr:hypothetical protein TCAL_05157 [Tigriopus californicus]
MSRQHQPFSISSTLSFPAVKRWTALILVAVCLSFHPCQGARALEAKESSHMSHSEEDLTMAANKSPFDLEIPRQERRLYRPSLSGREDSYSAQIIEYFESEKDYHDEDTEEISNEVPVLPKRGLVPQLWPNYTGPPELPAEEEPCHVSQLKCAYRDGCGLAIQNYMLACSALAEGKTTTCTTYCKHSLIALMSTPEGKRLMKDTFPLCKIRHYHRLWIVNPDHQTELLPTFKPKVNWLNLADRRAARWICAADPQCSTALDYYHQYCAAMFKGKKCTKRCLNAIHILKKQTSASKLEHCVCDGSEDFQCRKIKDNMEQLCFNQPDKEEIHRDIHTNEIDNGASHLSTPTHVQALLMSAATWRLFAL